MKNGIFFRVFRRMLLVATVGFICMGAVMGMSITLYSHPVVSKAAFKPKKKVELSKKRVTLKVGSKVTLKLKNAAKKKVKWTTSSARVTSLKTSGTKVTVTGKKKGTAVVSAKVDGKRYKCKVTVKTKKKKTTVPSTPAPSVPKPKTPTPPVPTKDTEKETETEQVKPEEKETEKESEKPVETENETESTPETNQGNTQGTVDPSPEVDKKEYSQEVAFVENSNSLTIRREDVILISGVPSDVSVTSVVPNTLGVTKVNNGIEVEALVVGSGALWFKRGEKSVCIWNIKVDEKAVLYDEPPKFDTTCEGFQELAIKGNNGDIGTLSESPVLVYNYESGSDVSVKVSNYDNRYHYISTPMLKYLDVSSDGTITLSNEKVSRVIKETGASRVLGTVDVDEKGMSSDGFVLLICNDSIYDKAMNFQKFKEQIVSEAKNTGDVFNQLSYFYNYIQTHFTFAGEIGGANYNHTGLEMYLFGCGSCLGDTSLFNEFCREAEIPCYEVEFQNYANMEGQHHAVNFVEIESDDGSDSYFFEVDNQAPFGEKKTESNVQIVGDYVKKSKVTMSALEAKGFNAEEIHSYRWLNLTNVDGIPKAISELLGNNWY